MANTASTFELRLTFSGLCMFVPAKDKKTMHVLMPATAGTGHPQHLMRLFHHPAVSSGTGDPSVGKPPKFIDITGNAIDLNHAGPLGTVLPAGIFNLSTICGKVDPGLLTGPPQLPVGARMSMTTGDFVEPNDGLIWSIGGKPHELASIVTWSVPGMPGNSLVLTIGGVDHTFHATGKRLELFVFNVPSIEIPDEVPLKGKPIICPGTGHCAHHFTAFYPIIGCSTLDAPTFIGEKKPGQCTNQAAMGVAAAAGTTIPVHGLAFGVSPVTCMLGGGDGGP